MNKSWIIWVILAVSYLVFFSCDRAYCAITLVSVSTNSTTNGSATSIASPSITDTNTGDLIIIACASQFAFVAGQKFSTPTTTSGLTVSASSITATTQIGGVGMWWTCTASGGFSAKTFTCVWTASAGPGSIAVEAWSGTACTNASPGLGIGTTKACNGTTGTTATCTTTTSANNSQVIGGGEDPDNHFAPVAGSNQTIKMSFNDATNAQTEAQEIQNATTATSGTSVTMNFTGLTSGDVWNADWLEILAPSSSGTPAQKTQVTIQGGKTTIQAGKVTIQ